MIGFAKFLIFCAAIAYNITASTSGKEKAALKQLILMCVGSINIHVKLQSGFLVQFAFLFSSLECNHIDFCIFLSISKSCCNVIKYVIVIGRIMFYMSESIYIRTNVHSNPTNP
jgi:hypothetical protein